MQIRPRDLSKRDVLMVCFNSIYHITPFSTSEWVCRWSHDQSSSRCLVKTQWPHSLILNYITPLSTPKRVRKKWSHDANLPGRLGKNPMCSRGNQDLSPQPDASDHPTPKKRPLLGSARGPENVVQNPLLVQFCIGPVVLDFMVWNTVNWLFGGSWNHASCFFGIIS